MKVGILTAASMLLMVSTHLCAYSSSSIGTRAPSPANEEISNRALKDTTGFGSTSSAPVHFAASDHGHRSGVDGQRSIGTTVIHGLFGFWDCYRDCIHNCHDFYRHECPGDCRYQCAGSIGGDKRLADEVTTN